MSAARSNASRKPPNEKERALANEKREEPRKKGRQIKWMIELGVFLQQLGEDGEFCFVHEEALEKLVRGLQEEVGRMRASWQALSEEDKLAEIAAKAPWKKSAYGDGEYVAAEQVLALVEAVKAKGGRLQLGEHAYVLSKNGKWLQRYPRGGGK